MISSKAELPVIVAGDGFVFRGTVRGEMRAEIATFDQDFYKTPFLKGLPDDLSPARLGDIS